MSEIRRHRQFDEWMDAIVDSDSGEYLGEESLSIRQGIENLIRVLETFRNPLVVPEGAPISGSRFELHELRWPSSLTGQGPSAASGVPIIRVLYGFARSPRAPATPEVPVILLGGNKTPTVDRWYNEAVPEAEKRLVEWCDDHLVYVPR